MTHSHPAPPDSEDLTRRRALIDSLIEYARTSDTKSSSRAALAELRRSVTDPLRAAPYVAPYLGEPGRNGLPSCEDNWCYTIAGLFAIHRQHKPGMTLGKAFKQIRDSSGSIEMRFTQLITADERRLEDLLRHAIRLLASKDVPLDWHRLLDDVLHWKLPDKPYQHRLARDFYPKGAASSNDSNS